MRTSLIALLLLGTAIPAAATAPQEESRAEQRLERRAAEREARAEMRAERAQRAEAAEPRFERREPRVEAPQRVERPVVAPVEVERREPAAEPRRSQERRRDWGGAQPPSSSEARPADTVSGWRWQQREAGRRERTQDGAAAVTPPTRIGNAVPPTALPRTGETTRARSGDGRSFDVLRDRVAAEGWRQEWRRDRRYDWRRYRDRDRSRFRVGIYIDPFGWNYRPWQLGWSLPSRFYSSRYWIEDPWYYRLPPVYAPYRWIRYYDDVLLVDMRSGRVVDRIPNFFW